MSTISMGRALGTRLLMSASTLAIVILSAGQTQAAVTPTADDQATASNGRTGVSEVVVTGRKAAALIALKQQSPVEVTAISAEEIQQRPVTNVVDAVSILPGISVYADNGLGQAATGEPEYVTINGIASNYNAYELNGARVPAADPSTRALSLKLLPPFGLQSIDVIKTPDASQDGDSIGGVLNIKTPSAFDYKGDLNKLTVQGQLNDLASNSGFNGAGGSIQGEFARKFMGDKLGIYGTIFYKQENSITEAGEVASYAPTYYGDKGLPAGKIALSPTQYKWDLQQNHIVTIGGDFGVDYHGGATNLYLRGSAVSYDDKSVDSQVNIRSTGSEYASPTGPNGTFVQSTSNDAVLTMLNPFEGHYFQLRDQVDSLYTVQTGGDTALGKLHLSYGASYGYASLTQPNYVEGSLYGAAQTGGTYQVGLSDGHLPTYNFGVQSGYNLTPAGVKSGALNQMNNAIWKYQGQSKGSDADQYGVKLDADYKTNYGFLSSIQSGIDINFSHRTVWDHYFVAGNNNIYVLTPQGIPANYNNPQGPTTNNVPGQNVSSFLNFPGLASIDQFRAFSRNAFVKPALAVKYQSVYCPPDTIDGRTCPGLYTINDYNAGAAYNDENIYAGYIKADLNFGKLDIYPGLRYEFTDFSGASWLAETATTGQYINLGHSYGEVLPSVNLVYRNDDDFVYRAAIRKGFSRPAFSDLIPNGSFSVDDTAQQVTYNLGNPKLKPTESVNYDAAIEYYGVRDAVFELDLYYKSLTNYIYTASTTGGSAPGGATTTTGALPSGITAPNGTTGYQVLINTPENGAAGHLEGFSANAQQRLSFLPGLAAGLGYRANITVQQSSTKLGTPLPQSPNLIYNLEATYDGHGLHADLSYQYTGLQFVNAGNGNDMNLAQYLQPTKFLNFAVGYKVFGADLSFQVKNLLNKPTYWKTVGKGTEYLGVQDGGGNGSYINFGRTYNITASYAF